MPRHFLPAELNMATTVPSFFWGGGGGRQFLLNKTEIIK